MGVFGDDGQSHGHAARDLVLEFAAPRDVVAEEEFKLSVAVGGGDGAPPAIVGDGEVVGDAGHLHVQPVRGVGDGLVKIRAQLGGFAQPLPNVRVQRRQCLRGIGALLGLLEVGLGAEPIAAMPQWNTTHARPLGATGTTGAQPVATAMASPSWPSQHAHPWHGHACPQVRHTVVPLVGVCLSHQRT